MLSIIESQLQTHINEPTSAVLEEHQKHISTFEPDFTFPATCVDRTPSVQANWTLCSLLWTTWTVLEMFCVSYATWKEMCFWNVIMGLTAMLSLTFFLLFLLVCICCCWMIALCQRLAHSFFEQVLVYHPFVMHFFQHYISFIIYSALSSLWDAMDGEFSAEAFSVTLCILLVFLFCNFCVCFYVWYMETRFISKK